MAGQPGNTPSGAATATLVGNAFVSQYYNVLHLSPHNVHRFYTEESNLSRAEAGADADIVDTQDKIQEKIMAMNLDGVQAQIKTVDSLASFNGSVLVMVTGALSSQIGLHRNFVQTFFLAPQQKGYFVLSDICRFLDGEGEHTLPEVISVSTTFEQDIEISSPSQQDVSEIPTSQKMEKDTIDIESGDMNESKDLTVSQEMSAKDEIESVVNAPAPLESALEEGEKQTPAGKVESTERAAKLSYASIVKEASFATSLPAGPRRMPPPQATSAPSTTTSQGLSQETMASSSAGVSNVVQDGVFNGGDGLSVYVKKLPLNIQQEDLEKEFQRFGSVKPGGVNLRNQKQGVCFAFIQFEDAISVRSAIEASPISIGGRQVYVEEKKPMSFSPSGGRGRAAQGRGYLVDSMNGRGNLGGRNFGRGGYNSEQDFSSRGRGGRGSYAANNSGNFVNGFRRGDNQVEIGSRPVRQGIADQ